MFFSIHYALRWNKHKNRNKIQIVKQWFLPVSGMGSADLDGVLEVIGPRENGHGPDVETFPGQVPGAASWGSKIEMDLNTFLLRNVQFFDDVAELEEK